MHKVGIPIPETRHAVSVSLPRWQDNIDYEEGKLTETMQGGYPRFVFHPAVKTIFLYCLDRFATKSESLLVLNARRSCVECREFMIRWLNLSNGKSKIRLVDFVISSEEASTVPAPTLNVILFPLEYKSTAKEFWQHTGLGISSRFAEYSSIRLRLMFPKLPTNSNVQKVLEHHESHAKVVATTNEAQNESMYVEERFGRNLSSEMAVEARNLLHQRIAGLIGDFDDQTVSTASRARGITSDHVWLFPTGMTAIYFAHSVITKLYPGLQTVQFGFPYTDTLKLQEKFGSGVIFYGHGNDKDLEDLRSRLESGIRIAAVFCEFPSNPLLKSPPLKELWKLSEDFNFCIVVDETIGNFLNINVLPYCHIVVSSLTKIFSGDSNVMGGSMIINPNASQAVEIMQITNKTYQDLLWYEDTIFIERNSRNLTKRVRRINETTEKLCDYLNNHPKIETICFPKYVTPELYLQLCTSEKGFGGLFSLVFKLKEDAMKFYDLIDIHKGPSLGTNFTLACPYTILAHYHELDWAASFGVDSHLIRFSIGLEEFDDLKDRFESALNKL